MILIIKKLLKKEIFINSRRINLKKKYLVILQHSVFKDSKNYYNLFLKTLEACAKTNLQTFIIYPNYDPGYKSIIELIKKYNKKNSKFSVFKNINRDNFLSLVANSCALGRKFISRYLGDTIFKSWGC